MARKGRPLVFDDDELAKAAVFAEASTTARTARPSHIKAQDAHLTEYRIVATKIGQRAGIPNLQFPVTPDDVNDHYLFPNNASDQIDRCMSYLAYVPKIISNNKKNNEPSTIATGTIEMRASHVLFWCERLRSKNAHHLDRKAFASRLKQLLVNFSRNTEILHKEAFERDYLSRDDILYFLGEDTFSVLSTGKQPITDIAAHLVHLALCIFTSCGVRPSSLWGCKGESGKVLTWGDVTITRSPSRGFVVVLDFQWLKGAMDKLSFQARKGLKLTFRTPSNPQRLHLSVPERLLAMLFVKGHLEDYGASLNDLDRLCNTGDDYTIRIKESAHTEPVFDQEDIAKYNSVNRYIQVREVQYGFEPIHTCYSLRGTALTAIERDAGIAKTQSVANHAQGSSDFRRHYDTGLGDLDLTGLIVDGLSCDFDENEAHGADLPAVVFRADFTMLPQRFHRELSKLARNPDFLKQKSGKTMTRMQFETVLAVPLWESMLKDEAARQKNNLSMDTVKQRTAECGHSTLLPRLRALMSDASETSDCRFWMQCLIRMVNLNPASMRGQRLQVPQDAVGRFWRAHGESAVLFDKLKAELKELGSRIDARSQSRLNSRLHREHTIRPDEEDRED